jgi:hypothetical protein
LFPSALLPIPCSTPIILLSLFHSMHCLTLPSSIVFHLLCCLVTASVIVLHCSALPPCFISSSLPQLLFFTALSLLFVYYSLWYISLGTWVCITILTS